MFKQLAAILLLVSFTAQAFTGLAIVGGYYANTAAYAKNCINKARPKLHCNGKCQMMKKLKQEEKKDQQSPEKRFGKEQVLSSKSFFASVLPVVFSLQTSYTSYHSGTPVDRSFVLLHPPGI